MDFFALLQGRYDRALNFLERSRQRYTAFGLTIQAVLAEHDIADAYLELNLAPEALAIYERVPVLAEHGMRAEQARAQAYRGRADAAGADERSAALPRRSTTTIRSRRKSGGARWSR